jgi:hypothetical protein
VRRRGAVQAMRERANRLTLARVVDAWWLVLDAVAAAGRRQVRHSRREAGSYKHLSSRSTPEKPHAYFLPFSSMQRSVTLGQTMHLSI